MSAFFSLSLVLQPWHSPSSSRPWPSGKLQNWEDPSLELQPSTASIPLPQEMTQLQLLCHPLPSLPRALSCPQSWTVSSSTLPILCSSSAASSISCVSMISGWSMPSPSSFLVIINQFLSAKEPFCAPFVSTSVCTCPHHKATHQSPELLCCLFWWLHNVHCISALVVIFGNFPGKFADFGCYCAVILLKS